MEPSQANNKHRTEHINIEESLIRQRLPFHFIPTMHVTAIDSTLVEFRSTTALRCRHCFIRCRIPSSSWNAREEWVRGSVAPARHWFSLANVFFKSKQTQLSELIQFFNTKCFLSMFFARLLFDPSKWWWIQWWFHREKVNYIMDK